MQNQDIEGWGADLAPRNKPGVPMERPPEYMPGAQTPIEPQQSDYPVMPHAGRMGMPPVYGTAAPPKALSGALRKLAYHYPDHWARHWMMLLFADRVDAWEHRLRRALPGGLAAAAVFLLGRAALKRFWR
jgi:hypothetical protein